MFLKINHWVVDIVLGFILILELEYTRPPLPSSDYRDCNFCRNEKNPHIS
jgi:hypothetical protein